MMYNKELVKVFADLESTNQGLTSHEAELRINKYGYNELKAQNKISPIKIFLEQFYSPLVWILIFALIVSLVLDEQIDALVIAIIIILNSILGFVQEYRAERAIEALKRMASLKARVLRNNRVVQIDSKHVVPGDILILETGDKVPADSRLIEIHDLQTQEGPLTGESQPVTKNLQVLKAKTPLADRKNMIYSSTVVTNGRGKALVCSTGMQTQVGKIATLIEQSHEKLTPLQLKLRTLGKYLTYAVILVAIVIFLAGIWSGQTASTMLLAAIALAVAAIPEGLPAVITISLALGVQRMIKKNVLVRKLPSVETLGSVDVICTDKTGTLTHNEMTVTKIYANDLTYEITGSGYESKGLFSVDKKVVKADSINLILKAGILCNDTLLQGTGTKIKVIGDPTEAALIVAAQKAGLKVETLEKEYPRLDETPFSSERKMMSTTHKTAKGKVSFIKGAPNIIINRCDKILLDGKVQRLDREKRKQLLMQNELFANQALRVLAFAYNKNISDDKDAENNLTFLGLQAMIDPPREEVKTALERCVSAGIRVIMITGDQLATAKAIGEELGIKGKAIEGKDIEKINLEKEIKNISIFARVNPEHKLHIVNALKKLGHVVAMTGDGVNDAPALKKADIGISMGLSGTDVAKEAADMILTDDNFTSIVNAVEEGRGIFDNIRKFVNYLLSSNLGEITVIFFATILRLPLPLTAIQILWVNLITDGLPATALSLDPHSKGIMQRPPRPAKENILSKQLRWDIIFFGILMGLACLGLFYRSLGAGILKAQTMVFTGLVIFELVRLQTIRSEYSLPTLSNKPLIWAVIISILLHLATIYTPLAKWFKTAPLTLLDWGIIILMAVVIWIIYRIFKVIERKFIKD